MRGAMPKSVLCAFCCILGMEPSISGWLPLTGTRSSERTTMTSERSVYAFRVHLDSVLRGCAGGRLPLGVGGAHHVPSLPFSSARSSMLVVLVRVLTTRNCLMGHDVSSCNPLPYSHEIACSPALSRHYPAGPVLMRIPSLPAAVLRSVDLGCALLISSPTRSASIYNKKRRRNYNSAFYPRPVMLASLLPFPSRAINWALSVVPKPAGPLSSWSPSTSCCSLAASCPIRSR